MKKRIWFQERQEVERLVKKRGEGVAIGSRGKRKGLYQINSASDAGQPEQN